MGKDSKPKANEKVRINLSFEKAIKKIVKVADKKIKKKTPKKK